MEDKVLLAVFGIVGSIITFLQKVLYGQNKQNYNIICDLIKRINQSDQRLEQIADDLGESAERRHEKLTTDVDNLSDCVNFIKGRINGGGGR